MSKDFSQIPADACTFRAQVELKDSNGEDSKTAPVRMLARSSKPIEHWFWGNVVHDTSGFNLNGRNRLSIDADHDSSQAIGYANRFEVEQDGLYMSGTLISHFAQDRADKIMRDMRAGIPYEASINFGGDGIKVEEVAEGMTSEVNGYQFEGPGVIIREWPLRNVAVTLLGADMNTASSVFSEGTKFSAQVVTHSKEADGMPEAKDEKAAEAPEAVELAQVEAAEEQTDANELSQAVEEEIAEAPVEEAVEAVEAEAEESEEVTTFTASDVAKMVTDFGQEIALKVVTNGGNYDDARELHLEAERAELAELREYKAQQEAKAAELAAKPYTGTKPAAAFSVDSPAKPAKKKIGQAAVRRTV